MNHCRHRYEVYRCRCDICRAANADHSAVLRHRQREIVRQRVASAEPGPVELGVKADLRIMAEVAPSLAWRSFYATHRAIALALAREIDHGHESKAAVCKVLRLTLAGF